MTCWTRSTRPLALLVIGSLATSAAQPVAAPKQQPTQQEIARARAHFKAAEAAKARRDYRTAAAEYLAAYELFADPEFFYDVGEVYRLAGDEPSALTYYQKYLELEPNGRGAVAARNAADELRRSIAAKQGAAKRAPDAEAKRKSADDPRRKADENTAERADVQAKRKAADEARRKADENTAERVADADNNGKQPATPPEVPSASPALATHVWYRDPITLALLGSGVAATAVGTGFLFSAQSLGHDAEQAKTYQEVAPLKKRASQRGTLGLITGGVGIALVGGGVAWIFLHRDSGEQRTVTGWLEPGGGGLAITGPF